MSKKHFELLAKYINSIMDPHARSPGRRLQWPVPAKKQIRRFDQDRFFLGL
jgi:hypothetical protein